tara:strand:- start:4332 stop:4847 length:516 start_codon:yes stop_codon:yes gene_type:complete
MSTKTETQNVEATLTTFDTVIQWTQTLITIAIIGVFVAVVIVYLAPSKPKTELVGGATPRGWWQSQQHKSGSARPRTLRAGETLPLPRAGTKWEQRYVEVPIGSQPSTSSAVINGLATAVYQQPNEVSNLVIWLFGLITSNLAVQAVKSTNLLVNGEQFKSLEGVTIEEID